MFFNMDSIHFYDKCYSFLIKFKNYETTLFNHFSNLVGGGGHAKWLSHYDQI